MKMNGKHLIVPFGMLFGKHYCSKCGERLSKEKTHRVVSKEDKDYYRYQNYNQWPRRDHDVYGYRFFCPACKSRIAYHEQIIIKRIQKNHKRNVLTSDEIKANYSDAKKRHYKSFLYRNIIVEVIVSIIAGLVYFFNFTDKSATGILNSFLFFLAIALMSGACSVLSYKGKVLPKKHPFENEALYEKLHALSSHNKELIGTSDKCYCYHCVRCMYASEVKSYTDGGETAICPKCGVDSLIPDSIDVPLDIDLAADMNAYWF